MALNKLAVGLAFLGLAAAQKPGNTPDVYPEITTYRCSVADGCTESTNYIVLDSSAHWVHQVSDDSYGCGDWGSKPNETACPTKEACAENCVMEGQTNYTSIGVKTDGSSLNMQLIVGDNVVSPRIYLLDGAKENYEMLQLTGNEIAFDVEASHLPCGLNSALYLSEMAADGGKSELNPGGAAWGTGYCDAQCYVTPFINGEGNVDGKGACCNEMDIWEANSRSAQIAPHPCSEPGPYLCTGDECARGGVCDKSGCGWNPYRLNQFEYYGRGENFTVDTTKPFTVVTQFPADESGKLKEIHRLYVQDDKLIMAEVVKKEGVPEVAFTNDAYCNATGATDFMALGAHEGMGDALTRGMVLTFSIWWDEDSNMSWLDGAAEGAGPCNATEGNPTIVRQIEAHPEVTFSNLKWGEIGSTYPANTIEV